MAIKDELNVIQSEINGVVSALTYGYFSHMNKAGVSSMSISGESSSISTSNIGNTTNSSNKMKIVAHGYQAAYDSKLESDNTVCDPKNIPYISMMKDKNGYTQYGASADLFIDYSIVDNGKVNSMEWTCNKIDKYINPLRSVCYGNDKFIAVTTPIDRYWQSVCYGNGKFVTVAWNSNYFAYSIDSIHWTEGTISNTSRNWYSVCYGNGKFVTVANASNYFAYSTDGINWTEGRISDTSKYWCSICYGNDKFVTISGGSHISRFFAYSTDGIHWTEGTISDTIRYWNSVCYGNDKFVTVADDNYFAYSTDGITWTESTLPSSRDWRSVCYGNDKFVTVANDSKYFAYSTDGINWTESTISNTSRRWNSVCYGNGKFVAVAISNYFAYSTDGINWTEVRISDTSRVWYSVCYGNDKYVAVTNSNYFAYSTDGINWTENSNQYNMVTYSTDGINWTEGMISITSREWYSVCYGNNKFVAVAESSNYFAYSTDGINWTESTLPSSRDWRSVCYGNDKFVTVANDSKYFAYSTDGINWTEGTISSTSRYWSSVCYGNDKYVAISGGIYYSSKYFAYSTDGINWTESTINDTSRKWSSICYGNDKFVTVAWNSKYFAYSTDGINWTEGTISSTSRYWSSVCYGNDKYVAVANSNYFAYSIDGITWIEGIISNTSRYWISVCYGNDKFVTVANDSNYSAVLYPDNSSFQYNLTTSTYNSKNILNDYIHPSYLFNYQTKEVLTTDAMRFNINLSNSKVKMLSSNSRYLNQYLEIPDYSSNISTDLITASQVLKDAINNGTVKFISNQFYNSSSWSDYNNEQFYKYLIFNDESYNYYLAITSDLMSFTTYKLPTSDYSFTVMNGVLFIYLPNKDSIAMITRHPNTTDIIEIDGNDPENMTDYNKPYYRLIEIPFLKKYYKYSGKHVQNVAIGAIGTLSNSTTLFGNYKYPADCTLLINVFNKVYRIGVPMFNANNIKACNTKRLQEFYTSDEQTTENLDNMTPISQVLSKYDSSDTAISCNINHRHFDIITDSNINITVYQMNTGYDSDIDETAPTTNKYLSNYTYVGANSLTDLSDPTFVLYPNAIY